MPDLGALELVGQENLAIRSTTMIRPAASMSARWENACGKLPRRRPASTSNSSAKSAERRGDPQRRSTRSRARCSSPMIASPDTSQNEQMRSVPSLPLIPSSVSLVLYRRTKPFSVSSLAIARSAARSRSSSGGRNPKVAASSVDASSASVS